MSSTAKQTPDRANLLQGTQDMADSPGASLRAVARPYIFTGTQKRAASSLWSKLAVEADGRSRSARDVARCRGELR